MSYAVFCVEVDYWYFLDFLFPIFNIIDVSSYQNRRTSNNQHDHCLSLYLNVLYC